MTHPPTIQDVEAIRERHDAFQRCEIKDINSASWDAINDRATLLAFISAQREVGGWREIESAPKDGTPIIVCGDGSKYFPRSCWWSLAFDVWVVRENVDDGEATFLPEASLTHWQPLPSPPQQKE